MKKYMVLDLLITFVTFLVSILIYSGVAIHNSFLGIYLLLIITYLCIKFKSNKKICLLFIILLYFTYSFVISRYIGKPTTTVANLFIFITNDFTHTKGILFLVIMFTIINLILNNSYKFKEENNKNLNINFKYRKILLFAMQVFLIVSLLYHVIEKISNASVLVEYSTIIFIFSFILSKNDKNNKIITEIIMIFYALYAFKYGQRVAILQFLLADFFINYIDKLKIKQIVFFLILGLFSFTFIGIYGDFLVSGYDNYNELTPSYVINVLFKRRFALDTSVSSYYTYLGTIESSDIFSSKERIKDGINYTFLYPVLGSTFYPDVDSKIRQYKPNYGGGYPVGYYYYYFGLLGVLMISIYIGVLLRKSMTINSLYSKCLLTYIVSTVPRWYLYEPTSLLRGVLIFSLVYFAVKIIFIKKEDSYEIKN